MKNVIKVIGFSCILAAINIAQASTIEDVKARGHVECGVSTGGTPGFAYLNKDNSWQGLDIDTCRMVATAIFGDASKVVYNPLESKERFTALQSGDIDLLSRVTTWTLSRDTKLAFDFAAINYFDGQGFIVNSKLGVKSAKELDGASVCTQSGTSSELNIADFFKANSMKYNPVVFEKSSEARSAFFSGRCDVFSSDASWLAALRIQAPNPDGFTVLPDIISKEPLGPLVRHGDNKWKDIVSWAFYASVEAEELGLTSKNVDQMMATTTNPSVKRFLGVEGNLGELLGVRPDYAYQIIKNVGNYGEVFDRNVGKDSVLKLPRGLNSLWSDGGMQYAPPAR
ncbi:amino acid ABC transporter substrate-binding protein [Vibrio sp. TH_r3]|uniref:amino acid ABC transporter substrate-binding protein n=1 Tax=Vibrio sp. TH_r3 TaxID=3082084 RepID=UPI00295506E0|nr:amino acid ABC transporter substrate-binding protein [Vibrio sp. TH_r3]MDV7105782.1 amino acid ABC transporter substrate-binding protein [Vibrio sp. TH_r3]